MCSYPRNYTECLAPRREELSNFMWVSRHIKPQVAYRQQEKRSPLYHKEEVLRSRKIEETLNFLSRAQSVPREVLEAEVKNILEEIGYNKNLKLIRWLGLLLVKICRKVCTDIYINADAVLKVKFQMGSCPVIFVPSHRSYADFILMSLICFSEDIAIPAIAAGLDFHGMWGMGTMLRNTGAFFMRRSYNDDSLYWTTFKQYVYQLVTKGELPIEFFIEGTRSRSNKSLMPKYGLILMILKAFFLSQVPDILFVPINLSYDRIMEEKLFAFELLGIPKPKETTSVIISRAGILSCYATGIIDNNDISTSDGFIKSLSILKEKFGSVYFTMAEPISAKKFFGPNLDLSVHNLRPLHQQEINEDEKKLIPDLAHEIIYQQQKHCVLTTFNLMAIALHNNSVKGQRLLNFDELVQDVLWLKNVMEALGAFVHMREIKGNILEALDVHKNIIAVNEKGEINLIWNEVVLDKVGATKLKAHALSEKTITLAVPYLMLQIYINPALHCVIDVAVLVTVLKYHGPLLHKDELFGHYRFLRGLFAQEFVTFHSRTETEFENALKDAFNLNIITENDGLYQLGSDKKLQEVMYNCIDLFILTYYVVCSILLKIPSGLIDERTLFSYVQAEIEARIEENASFIHPYSLSLDTISNCLNTLLAQRVLRKSKNKGSVLYEISNGEVLSIHTKLEIYVPQAQLLQKIGESVHLHLKNKL